MAQSISARESRAKNTAPPSTPVPDAISTEETNERKDFVRRPFGAQTQRLFYAQRPGYHRHWFNYTPGRIDDALAAGYVHVKDADGKNVKRVVGVTEGGGPMEAFLMEIPKEWYDADMKAQQDLVTDRENAIKRGNMEGQVGVDGRYIPAQGITIKRG